MILTDLPNNDITSKLIQTKYKHKMGWWWSKSNVKDNHKYGKKALLILYIDRSKEKIWGK